MGETGRKSVHLFFGSFFILSALFISPKFTLAATAACFISGVLVSNLIKKGVNFPFFSLLVKLFERDYEKELPGKGAIMFFAGSLAMMLAAVLLGRPEIIAPALVPLVFGDGLATIIGIKYGKHKITGGKSWEGTIAGFIASVIVLSLLLSPQWAVILAVAATAMIVEILPIDDNLTIPIISGLVLYIIL